MKESYEIRVDDIPVVGDVVDRSLAKERLKGVHDKNYKGIKGIGILF